MQGDAPDASFEIDGFEPTEERPNESWKQGQWIELEDHGSRRRTRVGGTKPPQRVLKDRAGPPDAQ